MQTVPLRDTLSATCSPHAEGLKRSALLTVTRREPRTNALCARIHQHPCGSAASQQGLLASLRARVFTIRWSSVLRALNATSMHDRKPSADVGYSVSAHIPRLT